MATTRRRTAAEEQGDLQAYDDLVARLYDDKDLAPATRELALAIAWAQLRDPERHKRTESTLHRVARLLGRDHVGRWRVRELIADDAPRYKDPPAVWAGNGSCVGPRVRPYRPRGGPRPAPASGPLVCGAAAAIAVIERDMTTGHVSRVHRYCTRHKEQADQAREQIEARGMPPAPVPNTGGRLGRYFQAEALIKLYARMRAGWEPPVWGVCADDWPTSGGTILVRKGPRLGLVVAVEA